jgi:hypothetical protein
MLKSISNLGSILNKSEQNAITGGSSGWPDGTQSNSNWGYSEDEDDMPGGN